MDLCLGLKKRYRFNTKRFLFSKYRGYNKILALSARILLLSFSAANVPTAEQEKSL
jgi:hypothetical protein